MPIVDCRLLRDWGGGPFRLRHCGSRLRLVGEPLRAVHDDIALLIEAAGPAADIWAGDVASADSAR